MMKDKGSRSGKYVQGGTFDRLMFVTKYQGNPGEVQQEIIDFT